MSSYSDYVSIESWKYFSETTMLIFDETILTKTEVRFHVRLAPRR
ncbi:unnamed protein product [Brassica rapa]|uniref:Uncharacterized protein n=1 Tax=Brassica campestris TaxID=3711 RepID=A0A3P6B9T3_BRACM|nr:unnamed protein product [Brassica rapa]VDC95974.1 unnamed protein product [Brassica rapa]